MNITEGVDETTYRHLTKHLHLRAHLLQSPRNSRRFSISNTASLFVGMFPLEQ